MVLPLDQTFNIGNSGATPVDDHDYKAPFKFTAKISANRQRIVDLFPTAHRRAFVASDRQRIVEVGGGDDCCSRRLGARSLSFLRSLRPRVGAGGYAGNLTNRWGNTRCAARTRASGATPRRYSPTCSPR